MSFVDHNPQASWSNIEMKGEIGYTPIFLFIKWYQIHERISCEKEEECKKKDKRYSCVEY